MMSMVGGKLQTDHPSPPATFRATGPGKTAGNEVIIQSLDTEATKVLCTTASIIY